MKYSKCKEINSVVRGLVRQGWSFRWGGKHGRIEHPDFLGKLTVPKTPSDIRSFYNFRSDLRRITGVDF